VREPAGIHTATTAPNRGRSGRNGSGDIGILQYKDARL
jgi:hypothetical protein